MCADINEKTVRLAFPVGEGWRENTTGVNTFFRLVFDDWQQKHDCVFVSPYPEVVNRENATINEDERVCRKSQTMKSSNLRLIGGYVKQLIADVKGVWRVRNAYRGRIIVLHDYGCETLPIAFRLVMPLCKTLAVVHTHPGQSVFANHPVRRVLEKLCDSSVSTRVFVSQAVKDCWAAKLGRPAVKGKVIHHGIPPRKSRPIPDDYPQKSKDNVDFVYLANFYDWKGQRELLAYWENVLEQCPSARLVFIGEGARYEACKQMVEVKCLGDSVLFVGHRTNGAEYLLGADVLLHLPREPEAFGFVLIEAMRAGLPVIASKLGGIVEIVRHEETGMLVDVEDMSSVVDVIVTMAKNAIMRKDYAERGKAYWQSHFSKARMLNAYDDVFRELTKR